MQELVYLLRSPQSPEVCEEIVARLRLPEVPEWVRLATLAPLSNLGIEPGTETAIIWVDDRGVLIGVEEDLSTPRLFVPWQNVAYLADGTHLKQALDSGIARIAD